MEFRDTFGNVEKCKKKIETEKKEMMKNIRIVLKETEMEKENLENRKRGWWDEECGQNKEEIRKKLRSWRREKGDERKYRKKEKYIRNYVNKRKRKTNDGRKSSGSKKRECMENNK